MQIVATILVASCLAFSSGYPYGYPGYTGYTHGYPGYPYGYPYAHYPYHYASPVVYSASLGAPGVNSVGGLMPLPVGVDGDGDSDGRDGGMANGAAYGYGGYGGYGPGRYFCK